MQEAVLHRMEVVHLVDQVPQIQQEVVLVLVHQIIEVVEVQVLQADLVVLLAVQAALV